MSISPTSPDSPRSVPHEVKPKTLNQRIVDCVQRHLEDQQLSQEEGQMHDTLQGIHALKGLSQLPQFRDLIFGEFEKQFSHLSKENQEKYQDLRQLLTPPESNELQNLKLKLQEGKGLEVIHEIEGSEIPSEEYKKLLQEAYERSSDEYVEGIGRLVRWQQDPFHACSRIGDEIDRLIDKMPPSIKQKYQSELEQAQEYGEKNRLKQAIDRATHDTSLSREPFEALRDFPGTEEIVKKCEKRWNQRAREYLEKIKRSEVIPDDDINAIMERLKCTEDEKEKIQQGLIQALKKEPPSYEVFAKLRLLPLGSDRPYLVNMGSKLLEVEKEKLTDLLQREKPDHFLSTLEWLEQIQQSFKKIPVYSSLQKNAALTKEFEIQINPLIKEFGERYIENVHLLAQSRNEKFQLLQRGLPLFSSQSTILRELERESRSLSFRLLEQSLKTEVQQFNGNADLYELSENVNDLTSFLDQYGDILETDEKENFEEEIARLQLEQKRVSSHQSLEDFIDDMKTRLSQLPIDQSAVIVGGTTTHQVVYSITKKDKDAFILEVFNTGAGASVIGSKVVSLISKTFSLSDAVLEVLYSGRKEKIGDLLEELQKHLGPLEQTTEKYHLQKWGTCTFSSVMAYLRAKLPRTVYLAFRAHQFARAARDATEVYKRSKAENPEYAIRMVEQQIDSEGARLEHKITKRKGTASPAMLKAFAELKLL